MHTITIDGQELRYAGLTEDRRGIRAGGRVYWMFPAVRWPDGKFEPLLPIGPTVIRRVTTEVPDLTAQFPETVKVFFDQRRADYAKITQAEHGKKYADDDWLTPEQFEETRKRILAETLEEFTRTRRARDYVWAKHGPPELAGKLGCIDRQTRLGLYSLFRAAGHGQDSAWRQVYRVQWAAYYADSTKSLIYLYDLIDEPDRRAAELELQRRETEAQERSAAAAVALAEAQQGHSELGEAVAQKIEQTHGAVVGLGAQLEGLKAAAAAAAEKAGEAKTAAQATKEAVVAKLIPQYENLAAVKDKEMREAAAKVLREMEMPTVDREIIDLR